VAVERAEQVARFTGAVANLTDGIKAGAVANYQLPVGDVVADIGGADGTLLAMLMAGDSAESLRCVVFDLPHVVAADRSHLAERGLSDRVSVVAGDFFESVPPAAVYVVSMILHDWDDKHSRRILGRMADAAKPGARLTAVEFVVTPGNVPHMSKVIDLTMLGMLTGRERTEDEFRELFASAGFRMDRVLATPTPLSIIAATYIGSALAASDNASRSELPERQVGSRRCTLPSSRGRE